MKLFRAEMASENFIWVAYDTTPEKAKKLIVDLWNSEPKYREKETLETLESYYGINIEECVKGECHYD